MGGRQDRFDIQFMRGVAVLAVVLFHAFPAAFGAGFLGVDVFFAISGFLITGIILKGLERKDFSFKEFYLRRARRLLPASLMTLGVTTALAFVFLTRSQIADYAEQLLGSLAFVANFVLAFQTGYFEGGAETKPLLHIWSLSLEEQFYFVAPLLLWLTPLRARPWLLATGMVLSFALCLVIMVGPAWLPLNVSEFENFAFFMLPTRAWELLAGSVCAWIMLRRPELVVPAWLKYVALVAIVATCAVGFDPVHPRGDALIVVLATCVILMGRDGWLPATALSRPVGRIGDWSYSLYLVHWPLFSFAYSIWGRQPPLAVMIGLVLLAVFLGWLQYRFIEQTFRSGWPFRHGGPLTAIFASFGLLLLVGVPSLGATSPLSVALAPNKGLGKACNQQMPRWHDIPACRTSETPTVAVWGDSYAMYVTSGLEGVPLVQMTKSSCAPGQGVAQTSAEYSETWARNCVSYGESVLRAIEAMPSVRYVIISSIFRATLIEDGQQLLVDGRVQPFTDAGQTAIILAIERLKAAGKVPIIVGPTPYAPFDAGQCNERRAEGKLIFGRSDCSIPLLAAQETDQGISTMLRSIGTRTGVEVLMPATVLCDDSTCVTRDAGGEIYYRDAGHLTPAGARHVMDGLGLSTRLSAGRP